jgi:uncharacterized protein (TIGR03437 family)
VNLACCLSISLLLSAGSVFAAPAPNSVQNPGSNTLPGLPNYGIAQGSVFVVYGSGLGPATLMVAPSLPLQTSLGGTSITVTVNGTTVNPLMSYTYSGQLAAVLPSNTPAGTGTLTVTYGGANGSTPIVVVASNFGVLSANETGTGPAVATHADYTLITGTHSANNGEEIVVWGTGLGPLPGGVSDADAPGALGNLSTPITVYIGGVQATVQYHGRNASDPGLDQVNVTIPASVNGCYISLVVVTGNIVSNTTTIAVTSSGDTCNDASGLSLFNLSQTFNNGTASIGTVSVFQESFNLSVAGVSRTVNISSGSAEFQKYTALQLNESSSVFSIPSIGSCIILISNSNNPTSPVTATGLDAGASIALAPPSGSAVSLMPAAGQKGYYSASLSAAPSGTYQFTGPGGADVGAFNASLSVPAALTWTNVPTAPVDRTTGFTLNWTGGDPNGYAIIEGVSSNPGTIGGSIGANFICLAPVAPGTFTVPTSVLLALPATSTTSASAQGIVLLGTVSAPQKFSAPGLDLGVGLAESFTGNSVIWQ